MNSLTYKLAGIAGMVLLCAGFFISYVHANPSQFIANSTSSCRTLAVTGTTTRVWQTPGAATTTVCLNTASLTSGQRAFDKATLLVYRQAAAPTTQTKITFEYSPECYYSASPDWYAGKGISLAATTTAPVQFTGPDSVTLGFASTTIAGLPAGDFDTIALDVPTPTNCVRAVITVPPGAASSSVWAELVGRVQN